MVLLEAIILSVLAASTPLLLAAIGELVTERSGVLNLGVEGMMIVGAACGFGGAWLSGSVSVGAICGIVAFLGRLNPVGILIAGLFLALTFIGGEQAQIAMKIPLDVTKVFQGILLFYVLACDSLILYRIRLIPPTRRGQSGPA